MKKIGIILFVLALAAGVFGFIRYNKVMEVSEEETALRNEATSIRNQIDAIGYSMDEAKQVARDQLEVRETRAEKEAEALHEKKVELSHEGLYGFIGGGGLLVIGLVLILIGRRK